MKKLLIFVIMGFLSACASKSVQLSPAETQEIVAANPVWKEQQEERNRQSFSTKPFHNYYSTCDQNTPDHSRQCSRIECIGAVENLKCFKTPMTKEELTALHSKNQASNYDIPTEKANCLNTEVAPLKRRLACDVVLRTHKKHTSEQDVKDVEQILKTFCDLQDVECKKNGVKFGNGSLDLRLRISTSGGHYTIKSFGQDDKYKYNFTNK